MDSMCRHIGDIVHCRVKEVKNVYDRFSRAATIPKRGRRTDGRTDRQTDRHRATVLSALCIASCSNNDRTISLLLYKFM